VGRSPGGAASVPDVVPQEKGFAPKLRGLEIVDGICTLPAQVPHGFILNRWDIDRGEVARAHQSSLFDGVTTVGFDPIPRLLGDQGGRDDPADLALFGQVTGEPIATWPSFIDKDEVEAFGLQPTDKFIDIALSRTDVPKGDDFGVRFLGRRKRRQWTLYEHLTRRRVC
jgi:hypothetical protein